MRAFLFRFLLSLALIFQGSAAACASIAMAADLAQPSTPTGDPGLHQDAADDDGCHGCPDCPDGHPSGSDCGADCGMIAALPALPSTSPRSLPVAAVLFMAKPSLVDFLQVPPTPPPIA